MPNVNSLYDAIVKTKVLEDQCTNFLLWLLRQLPSGADILGDICKKAGVSISRIDNDFSFDVQYLLDGSKPDGRIMISENQFLLIETKRFPNSFDTQQFNNHLTGGIKEFGKDNIRLLFISGDEKQPAELTELIKINKGIIGFVSWKDLLNLLREQSEKLDGGYKVLINEFLIFANHLKLGRLVAMTNEDITRFLEVYPLVAKYKEDVEQKYNEILEKISNAIIIECNEDVKINDDDFCNKLPCIYKSFNINKWPSKENSAYLFFDFLDMRAGILLTGYQDGNKEKRKFLPIWNDKLKNVYKKTNRYYAFNFIDNVEFKAVENTKGKLFNPEESTDFSTYFYFGTYYDLKKDITILIKNMPSDFNEVLNTFLTVL